MRANATVGRDIFRRSERFQFNTQSEGRRHLGSVKHQRRDSPHAPGGTFMPDMSGYCPDRIRKEMFRIATLTPHRKNQRVCQYAHFNDSHSSGWAQNGRKYVYDSMRAVGTLKTIPNQNNAALAFHQPHLSCPCCTRELCRYERVKTNPAHRILASATAHRRRFVYWDPFGRWLVN